LIYVIFKYRIMKRFFIFFTIILSLVSSISASEPAIWSVNTRAAVLKGDAKGVSISDIGTITLAPKLAEIFNTEQYYVWSSAVDEAGNVFLGTGGDGRIYRIDASGSGKLFADLNELNVSALAIGRDGALYAGTSPDGKVYRIPAGGAPEVFFEPKEKYVWSLAVLGDGSLAVGTGESGKIYRVNSKNAAPESSLLFDTSETHIISLATDKQGNLYAGTDAKGLVLRFSPDGKPFAMLDSSLREIHQIAVGNDNSIYALAVSESASAAKTASTATTESSTASAETTAPQPEPPPKSRYDLSTAKSAVYRILPDGGSDVIWNSATVTAFSIAANPNGNGVFIGTSDKGRIYSVTNTGQETLLLQSNEGQISTFQMRGNQIFATSSNQGKLYRASAETVAEGSYESSVLDAKAAASWGRIWWRSNGNVALQTRSGNTEKPDETWSDWSANPADQKGAQISSPKAKFLQWRAILKSSASSPGSVSLNEVSVSYLAGNIAPEVLSIQILPTNVGLLANPLVQIDPNIENSGLDPTVFGLPPATNIPPRRVYQRGARALQWTAEDRNGDRLEYTVYYREASENNFKMLRENLRENFFTLDGAALADGRYIFKIAAKDSPSNPTSQSLSGEKISEPVDIDNTAPTVSAVGAPQISGDRARVTFEASDSSNYLKKAEYSVNGGDWQEVYADDGISDGARERYSLEIPLKNAGEYSVSLRVFDANGNAGSARVLINGR
jgi:sugar lactone lactonase YvrE